ncbi:DUF4372 domain-containing protein [Flavobacterium soyae]|uniref:DUF4372 domain-containing protein n=1 Tax=Flavobacterium soyae TaxID=2903098 RepID=A0ABZ2UKK2_9FLAO
MKLEEVLGYIPKEELEKLSLACNVDQQVKKLHGQTMFQLLLFSMLNIKHNSLRAMEEFYHSLTQKYCQYKLSRCKIQFDQGSISKYKS